MSGYPTTYTLPHSLVGMLESEQVHQMARSGWGFSPDQQWQKLDYANEGEPETPLFLVAIIEDLIARDMLRPGAYPGSAAEAAPLDTPTPSTGRWSKVADALAASSPGHDLQIPDDAELTEFLNKTLDQGMAVYLKEDEDARLVEQCRGIHDYLIGWSDEDAGRMDELAFSWEDHGTTGRIDEGLTAFDAYLQQRCTGKRLVAVTLEPHMFFSLLAGQDHVETVIAGLAEIGLSARLQDADEAHAASTGGTTPVADGRSPLVDVMPRMNHMPIGAPGQVSPMSAMSMDASGVSMPGRVFSHEIGVIFVRADGVVVTKDHLEAAGINEDQLLELAIANLSTHVSKVNVVDAGPQRMLTGLGGLETCVALVSSFWDQMAADCPNGLVIAIPAKDVLLFADQGNAEAIENLRSAYGLLQQKGSDGLLSESLYARQADGSWVVFDESSSSTTDTPTKKRRFWNR